MGSKKKFKKTPNTNYLKTGETKTLKNQHPVNTEVKVQLHARTSLKVLYAYTNKKYEVSSFCFIGRKNFWKNIPLLKQELSTLKNKYVALKQSVIKRNSYGLRAKQLHSLLYFRHLLLGHVSVPVLFLFLLKCNKTQIFLNFLGINFFYFNFYSSGRCLAKEFGKETSRSLKKSQRLNKALIEYFFKAKEKGSKKPQVSHTYITPLNKKTMQFYDQMQSASDFYPTALGFSKYFKINYKRARRIKKRIKKRLIFENNASTLI